jgi:hypothetical protein
MTLSHPTRDVAQVPQALGQMLVEVVPDLLLGIDTLFIRNPQQLILIDAQPIG